MIRIYGASDDLLEIEGDVREELDAYDCGRCITIGDEKGGLLVLARYGDDSAAYSCANRAVWRLAVEPIDEGVPMPWPVRVELAENGYSPVVIVDCPPGTPIAWDDEEEA